MSSLRFSVEVRAEIGTRKIPVHPASVVGVSQSITVGLLRVSVKCATSRKRSVFAVHSTRRPYLPTPHRSFKDPARRRQAVEPCRSDLTIASASTSPMPSPSRSSAVRILDVVLSMEETRILVKQGQRRFEAAEWDWHPRTVDSEEPTGTVDQVSGRTI